MPPAVVAVADRSAEEGRTVEFPVPSRDGALSREHSEGKSDQQEYRDRCRDTNAIVEAGTAMLSLACCRSHVVGCSLPCVVAPPEEDHRY